MELERREVVGLSAAAVVGVFAGCSGDDGDGEPEEDDDATPEETETDADEPLGIEHVRLVDGEPDGYREYEEVADGSYAADDVVWIYYEPAGLATEDAGDGEERISVRLVLTVTDPDGDQSTSEEAIERNIRAGSAEDEQWLFWNYQPPVPAEPGEYTAEITLVDRIADEEVTETVTFTIESSEEESG